ncbi:MAG: alcohol dehydrogenase catalytic domain-containing protein, partial [Syntrophales bacterium]|nr:alcohol dehydrogenase catalytic domain-containing protein [Syntrophales bacterium]
MDAVIFYDNEDIRFESEPDPGIVDGQDALVRVTTASICSSDIHIRHHGREMQVKPGTILGHEFVGIIEDVGEGVKNFAPGDRVAVSCTFSCGKCFFCRKGLTSQCELGACFGAMGDGNNHGAHAEFIKIPYASRIMHKIPDALSDDDVLFVGDILSTGLFGIDQGGVKEGDTVAVFGAGPVGICAMIAARLRGASKVIAIEKNDHRRSVILKHRLADEIISPPDEKPARIIKSLTQGRGADVVVDAAGDSLGFGIIFDLVRRGGTVSLLGVYNDAIQFHIYRYWWKNITIKMGMVETGSMGQLIEWIEEGRIDTRFL